MFVIRGQRDARWRCGSGEGIETTRRDPAGRRVQVAAGSGLLVLRGLGVGPRPRGLPRPRRRAPRAPARAPVPSRARPSTTGSATASGSGFGFGVGSAAAPSATARLGGGLGARLGGRLGSAAASGSASGSASAAASGSASTALGGVGVSRLGLDGGASATASASARSGLGLGLRCRRAARAGRGRLGGSSAAAAGCGPGRTPPRASCRSRPRAPDGVRRRVAALRSLPALRALAPLARGGDRRRCAGLGHGAHRRLLGLLEAEPQAMALGVEADDLELEGLALVHHVARMGHALVRQLADVDQALEALPDPDEGAEVDELRDRAVDDVADLEVRDRRLPRVGLEPADREADPAALVVDVDDLGLDLVADLVAGLGVVDLVPARARSCGRGRRSRRGR